MVGSLVRSAAAVVVGLVAAMALVIAVEVVTLAMHPFPPGVDPSDLEACKAHVARFPAGVLLVASLGWGLTTFVGAWLATRLGSGRRQAHGILVGAILFAAAVMNMSMLPYPAWFWASNLLLLPLGFACGARIASPARPGGHGVP